MKTKTEKNPRKVLEARPRVSHVSSFYHLKIKRKGEKTEVVKIGTNVFCFVNFGAKIRAKIKLEK